MFKNLIFDIDGTIWNSTAVVALAWIKAAKELSLPWEHITADRLKKEFGKPMDDIFDSLFPDSKDASLRTRMKELLYVYEHEFLHENNEDLTYPGLFDSIQYLSKNHSIFIVSNCQKGYIELVMEKTGITEFISDYLCFGDTLQPKNYTIEKVIERNKLDKKECCYIGDIQGDADATHKAGIQFIHASWGFGEVKDAEYVAADFSSLIKIVD